MTDVADRAKAREMLIERKALEFQQANREAEPEQWIEDGTVLCIDCGDQVPPARLAAKPTAARCVSCQAAHEYWREHCA